MTNASLFLNLFKNKEAKSFSAGQFVFKAGDPGDSMYIITEGEVDIVDGSTSLEIAGPGSIVGELALIDDEPRSATAVARTDSRLVAVDRRRFEFMVTETPFFALAVMKVLADRLRRTNARIRSN
jgi:CRP/FNR family cyclic AMP-dependent transcriptional regulator